MKVYIYICSRCANDYLCAETLVTWAYYIRTKGVREEGGEVGGRCFFGKKYDNVHLQSITSRD